MKIRNKYFKAIALLSAAFVAGAVFITYQGYKEAIEVTKRHFGNHHLMMAEQASLGIEKNLHAMIRLLSALSKERAIRDMDIEKSRILLEKVYQHARAHSVNDVALMDSAGAIRLTLNAPYLEGKDFSFRGYYQKAKELKTSTPVYEHVTFKGVDTGKKGIVIAVPVLAGEERFGGLVLFTVKVEQFLEDLLSGQKGSDKTWVIDSGGNILYHPDYPPGTNIAELADGSDSFRAFVADIMADGHRHSEYISPEGIATTAACYPVSAAGQTWEVVVSSPKEESTGLVAQSSKKYGIGILLLVIASASIALTLKAYNNALEKAHYELEARVKERTADLEVAEGELRSIYNSISGYITVISPDYRILSYNETVERQFGGGLKGKPCYEAFQARDAVCPDCAVKQTLETKKPAYSYQPATYLSKPVEIYAYPIFDEKGEVAAVVEHGIDVGERMELEENFNRQRVLMNTVFETTPDIMYIKDIEGKYVIVNSAFEKIIGVSCDEAVGKTMEDILPGEFAAESRSSDLRVLDGDTYHKEQRAITDGQEIIFDTIKMPLRDKDGTIYGIVGISRDITGLKRADEALRESEELYRNFTTNFQGIAFRGNMNFVPLFFHGAVEKITGYKEQDFLSGKPRWDEVIHPEDRDRLFESFQKIKKTDGFSDEREYRIVRKDGEMRWVREYIQNVCDDSGKPVYVQGSIYDVHERRLAEENRLLLLKAIESLTVGVTISDADGKILYTNPAEAAMHGYKVEELMGKNVNCLAPSELWKDIELNVRGRAFSRESLNQRKDGSVFPVYLTSVRVGDDDSAPFTIITVCEDITERKRAEEALRRSEERYRALIDNIAVGIAVISPQMEIISVNRQMQEWFPDIDISGRPVCYRTFNHPPRDSACSYCPTAKTLQDGEVHAAITDTPAGDEIRHYNIVSSPLRNENGEIIAAIEMCEDITERQRAAEELRAAKVTAEEEKAKTEAIIACIGDGISIQDRDFKVLYQNEAHVGMIGRHVGEYCYKAYEGKDHICEGCPLAKALEDGGIHVAERNTIAGDSLLHVSITASSLRDAEGNIVAGIEVVRNITERKQAEEELAYNQLFLKSIIENEPECVKLLDAEGTLIDMNSSGLKMIGADSLDQVKGKNVYSLVAPEYREAFKAHVEKVCQGEKSMLEFRAIGLKGRSIWLETHAVPFNDAREKRTLLLAVTRDITQRKEADTILREREKQLSESQRIAHIGSWQHNLTTNAAVWSDELFRVLGLDPEKDPADFDMFFSMIHPEDQPKLKNAIAETLETGKHFSVDYRFRMRDGRTRILHAQAELVTDETGTQSILSGTGQDITDRKEAEDEIKEINARLQTLVDSIPGMVFFKDAEGRHLVVNRAAVEMIGVKEEEIIGKTVYDFFPADIAEHCTRSDEEVAGAGKTVRTEEDAGLGKTLETIKAPLFDEHGNYAGMVGLAFDVTERKQAEDALLNSEAELRKAQAVASIGSWHLDIAENVLRWSEETHRIFGVPKGTPLTYESFLECVHPDDRGLIDAAWKAALKGKHYDMEHRITVDGRQKWIREQGEIRFDESGTAVEALGTAHDITERKRVEEALRKSEERYRGLFESARDAIMIAVAESGVIVNANRQAEKLLGRPASEIIGMNQSELHPEEDKEWYISAFRESVKKARAEFPEPGGDMYVVNKEGRKIPVEISANVIRLEGKRFIQGIFRDITGRRAAERAAREGQQYLENVLNSIQDGICIIDMDYNIVKVNPTIEKWYAHRAPFTGKKCYEIFKGISEICEHCPCSKVIVKGESCTETIPYIGPDGPSGTMELHAFPLLDPETGKAKGIIKYFRDVTDKVALEAEAFRAAQLASVGELAAGVAHEINNPINGIINYAQLLVNRLQADSEESSISRRIIKEGDRISGIVSALLAFTREDALMEEPVDLEDLVLEALSLTIAQLSKDGIDVRINIPENMPKVNIKRQHLEQVFLNIINNARHALNAKYSERHPEKALNISGEILVAEDIPHIRVSFIDWGTGIAPDIIDRVTEPFFTTKQKGSGTGLGLSISSSIIKNSGGTLSIDSVEGEYTKVIIELPTGGA